MEIQVITILCLTLCGGASCYKSTEIIKNTEKKPSRIHRLLVLPFQDISGIYGENVSIRCQLCTKVFTTGHVVPGAAQYLTNQLNDILDREHDFKLIPASQALGVISILLEQSGNELTEIDLYLKTGQALGADKVLAGYVYQFRDREGSDYSVDQPASVAFHMDMIHVVSGQMVWSGHFNETQRSLSEDLFQMGTFIKRKGRWITAEALAAYGLQQILKKLPPL